MKRNALVIGAVAMVAIVAVWYFLLYSPANDDLTKAQAETEEAQKQTDSLRATLAQLESLNATEQAAQLRRLDAAIPENPDLAEFIIQANDIADQAGISFLSIAPSPPAAGTGSSVIQLTITIEGSYFQLEDYLRQLEQLERLVIVDGITISAGTAEEGSSSGSGIDLSVSLTGRMFTSSPPVDASGAPVTPTDPSPTTTTTAPGGTDSTTTTVPSGSTTTGGA